MSITITCSECGSHVYEEDILCGKCLNKKPENQKQEIWALLENIITHPAYEDGEKLSEIKKALNKGR